MDLCYAFIESGKVRHTNEPDYFHIYLQFVILFYVV